MQLAISTSTSWSRVMSYDDSSKLEMRNTVIWQQPAHAWALKVFLDYFLYILQEKRSLNLFQRPNFPMGFPSLRQPPNLQILKSNSRLLSLGIQLYGGGRSTWSQSSQSPEIPNCLPIKSLVQKAAWRRTNEGTPTALACATVLLFLVELMKKLFRGVHHDFALLWWFIIITIMIFVEQELETKD